MKKFLVLIMALMLALSGVAVATAEETPVPATIALNTSSYIVGHRAEATATAEGVTGFQWKSSAPKIASVSAKGVIQFKKPGQVTITVTAKGKVKAVGAVTIDVVQNSNAIETSRVYLKGNYVYADILYTNAGDKPVKKLGKTEITVSGIEGHSAFTAKSGMAKKAIKAGEAGYVTFKLMKVNKAEIDLTKAVAAMKPAA